MTLTPQEMVWAPERNLSLWGALQDAAKKGGKIRVADVTLSYGELAERADRLAGGLASAGISAGDRIVLLMSDRIQIVELLFAACRLGALIVPINPFLKGLFLRNQLTLADPKVIVADAPGLDAISETANDLPSLTHLLLVEDSAIQAHEDSGFAVMPLNSLYRDRLDETSHDPDGRLPLAIMFTSGTTGASKGCVLSRGYFIKFGAHETRSWNVTENDVMFTALPMFHGAGLICALMTAIVSGASIHLTGAFHASTFFAEIAEAGATIATCIGAMGGMLLAQPERPTDKAHKLRLLQLAPFSVAAQTEFSKRFNVPVWTESFGQTECLFIGFSQMGGKRNPASCGMPVDLVEVGILDDDGHPLPPGGTGEIAVRPKTSGVLFQGYWRNPDATVQNWRHMWHLTGDVGYLDPEGFIKLRGRKKDCVRRRGENISLSELEQAVAHHPAIQTLAAHAVPSELVEDDIKLCIILNDGHELIPETFFRFLSDNLPYFAIPRYVEFFDDFPLTGSMKIAKEELRALGNGLDCWDFEKMELSVSRNQRRATGSSPSST